MALDLIFTISWRYTQASPWGEWLVLPLAWVSARACPPYNEPRGKLNSIKPQDSSPRLSSRYGHERISSRPMVIRARTGKDGKPYRTGHKPLALVYSLALHMGVVALLFLPSSVGSTTGVY